MMIECCHKINTPYTKFLPENMGWIVATLIGIIKPYRERVSHQRIGLNKEDVDSILKMRGFLRVALENGPYLSYYNPSTKFSLDSWGPDKGKIANFVFEYLVSREKLPIDLEPPEKKLQRYINLLNKMRMWDTSLTLNERVDLIGLRHLCSTLSEYATEKLEEYLYSDESDF